MNRIIDKGILNFAGIFEKFSNINIKYNRFQISLKQFLGKNGVQNKFMETFGSKTKPDMVFRGYYIIGNPDRREVGKGILGRLISIRFCTELKGKAAGEVREVILRVFRERLLFWISGILII